MLKRLLSLLAIVGIVIASNFSRMPENKDPIIGAWSTISLNVSNQTNKQAAKKEWIFNDAYLGRYHSNGGAINIVADFKWHKKGNLYTLSYIGLENKTNDTVLIKELDTGNLLQDTNGNTLAVRE